MQNVPKIVRARLRQQSPVTAESHPDVDLLTAFAEQSLTGRERDSVVDHLARCGDCREVVALALPATEAAAPVDTRRAGWLVWPVLRWGFVAAGILAVTSVGVLQFSHRQATRVSTSLMARNQVADTATQILSPAPQELASPPPLPPAEIGKRTETEKKVMARSKSMLALDKAPAAANGVFGQSHAMAGSGSVGGIGGASRGGVIGGAIQGRDITQRNFASQSASQPAAAPATPKQNPAPLSTNESVEVSRKSEVVEVQSAAPAVSTETTSQNQLQGKLIQNEQVQSLAMNGRNESVVRAKPTAAQAGDPGLMKTLPRWTISSSGALQRSVDGGKSWLDVNIAVDTSLSSNYILPAQTEAVKVEARSQTKMVTKADAKTAKDKAKLIAPPAAKSANAADATATPTIFRALSVSANAAEVWAGGSAGALYHTLDGNLWLRVVPSAAGVVLTGDIVSIQFSDQSTGTVTTSNAEVWATNDAGQTWIKQQ